MSYKFTIQQALAGYCFLGSNLLRDFSQIRLLIKIQSCLLVELYPRIESLLLADIEKPSTQICRRLMSSPQVTLYWPISADVSLANRVFHFLIDIIRDLNNQYIQLLRKLLTKLFQDWDDGDIFDSYIVMQR